MRLVLMLILGWCAIFAANHFVFSDMAREKVAPALPLAQRDADRREISSWDAYLPHVRNASKAALDATDRSELSPLPREALQSPPPHAQQVLAGGSDGADAEMMTAQQSSPARPERNPYRSSGGDDNQQRQAEDNQLRQIADNQQQSEDTQQQSDDTPQRQTADTQQRQTADNQQPQSADNKQRKVAENERRPRPDEKPRLPVDDELRPSAEDQRQNARKEQRRPGERQLRRAAIDRSGPKPRSTRRNEARFATYSEQRLRNGFPRARRGQGLFIFAPAGF